MDAVARVRRAALITLVSFAILVLAFRIGAVAGAKRWIDDEWSYRSHGRETTVVVDARPCADRVVVQAFATRWISHGVFDEKPHPGVLKRRDRDHARFEGVDGLELRFDRVPTDGVIVLGCAIRD